MQETLLKADTKANTLLLGVAFWGEFFPGSRKYVAKLKKKNLSNSFFPDVQIKRILVALL